MTRKEYENNYLKINGMTITPECTINIIKKEVIDEKTQKPKLIDVEDYIITKTAQQVYDEGMARKNNPQPQPPTIEQKNRADIDYLMMMGGHR